MTPVIDLSGQWFGALEVVRREPGESRHALWRCRCRCGREIIMRGDKLRQDRRMSCGRRGCARSILLTVAHDEYNAWHNMLARCYAKTNIGYHNYGGKGIVVCERWRSSFENFLSDMRPRPGKGYSLDRYPDPFGNYEPTNCRWATRQQQMYNTRTTIFVEYEGERVSLAELVHRLGLSKQIVYGRFKSGWSLSDALLTPVIKTVKPKSPPKRIFRHSGKVRKIAP